MKLSMIELCAVEMPLILTNNTFFTPATNGNITNKSIPNETEGIVVFKTKYSATQKNHEGTARVQGNNVDAQPEKASAKP